MKINKVKILKVLKTLLMYLVPLVCYALVHNAFVVYITNISVCGALAYLVQVVVLIPVMCMTFAYALKQTYAYLKSVYKKRIKKTDEMNKVLQLKTYFDLDFFPDKYLKVYDEHNNFVGYLVDKKKEINNS
jgi:hypothetical protein